MERAPAQTTPQVIAQCPACGGPPLHPGICVDGDGYVLPAYESLAQMWEEQGRPHLTPEEMEDLEELMDQWEEEREPG